MSASVGLDASWPYPGARWWKLDFHAHTPASADFESGPDGSAVPGITPSKWLLAFMRAKVDCVAITDHNSGEWIDKLKEQLPRLEEEHPEEFRPLHLFPGVEISVNGGFHLLAIFDLGTKTADINNLLGAVGYSGTKGDSDGVTTKSAVEVVKEVLERGGIPIPAHADCDKGLLRLKGSREQTGSESVAEVGGNTTDIDPNTVAQVLDVEGIIAMEIVDSAFSKPQVYRERKVAWSEVLGSDSHHVDGSLGVRFPGSHYTWVKMPSPPSLDGLRMALLDGPRFSIRRSDENDFDPYRTPEHHIESVTIRNCRYMGLGDSGVLRFSPLLNAIVGGRGTGKSTVIHALRLAMNRDGEISNLEVGSMPRATFERFNRVHSSRTDYGGLKEHTEIKLVVMRKDTRHRLTCRPGNAEAAISVEDEHPNGEWTKSASHSVTSRRFPVGILSQGQIAELAEGDRSSLLHIIDEAADVSRHQKKLDEARKGYLTSRARVRELEASLDQEGELIVELQDVEAKLKQLENSDHSTVLDVFRSRAREHREAERRFTQAEDAAQQIATLSDEIELGDIPEDTASQDSSADRDYMEVMSTLDAAVDVAVAELKDTASRLRKASSDQRAALSGSLWQSAEEQARNDYECLDRELRSAGISDPSEYGQLVQERHRIMGDMKKIESRKEERERRIADSEEQLRRVQRIRQAISAARETFLGTALADNKFVSISVRPIRRATHVPLSGPYERSLGCWMTGSSRIS